MGPARLVRVLRDTLRLWGQSAGFLLTAAWPRPRPRDLRSGGAPRLMLLVRYLPPWVNGGVYRPTALLAEAAARGWPVAAVSHPPPERPSDAGLELARRLPDTLAREDASPDALDASHWLSPRIDGGFPAIRPIVRAALRLAGDRPPSVVVASGPPFAEFVAAAVLSARWRVPLVLDYRDEWSECPFEFVRRGNADRFWERVALRAARLVCFTTESHRTHQLAVFPVLPAERTCVVPNGWFGPLPDPMDTMPDLGGGRPVIAYLGNFSEYSDAGEFLATLSRAGLADPSFPARVRFAFVGQKGGPERAALAAFQPAALVRDADHLPLTHAQAIMRGSAALLLLNSRRLARYLPGKVFEYLAAGTPILLYGEGGELEQLLADQPHVRRVRRGDAEGLLAAAGDLAAGRVPRSPGDPEGRFSRARRAKQLVDEIERLLL